MKETQDGRGASVPATAAANAGSMTATEGDWSDGPPLFDGLPWQRSSDAIPER